MSLRLQSNDAYPWNISFSIFDGGDWRTIKGTVHYKVIDKARQAELMAGRNDGEGDADQAVADEVLDHWSELPDLDGKPIEHSPENREMVLNATNYVRAIVQGYFDSLDGPAKNSKKRRGR